MSFRLDTIQTGTVVDELEKGEMVLWSNDEQMQYLHHIITVMYINEAIQNSL